jgi:hypothetical protein
MKRMVLIALISLLSFSCGNQGHISLEGDESSSISTTSNTGTEILNSMRLDNGYVTHAYTLVIISYNSDITNFNLRTSSNSSLYTITRNSSPVIMGRISETSLDKMTHLKGSVENNVYSNYTMSELANKHRGKSFIYFENNKPMHDSSSDIELSLTLKDGNSKKIYLKVNP